MKFAILAVVLASASSFGFGAQAASRPSNQDQVLDHPMTRSVITLLEKAEGTCNKPEASDIKWMCTGALPVVTEPTIFPNTCFFRLSLTCGGRHAELSGSRTSYSLLQPGGHVGGAKQTDAVIIMDSVELR